MEQIYLDYNASTPIAPVVLQAMAPYFTDHFGNPSTSHFAAVKAKEAVEKARAQVATSIGANPEEILFTSGGTESNNHVLKQVYEAKQHLGNHIITSTIEHPAILEPLKYLETKGAEVTYVDVDECGCVSVEQIEQSIRPETILISIMHANNEVGTIQPIREIGELAKEHDILFHTDAAQSMGKININVHKLHVDFLSIAGHKLYAPKGVGALYIRDGIELDSFIHGAGHERGRRAGTENVLFAVALGAACEYTKQTLPKMKEVQLLRDEFFQQLKQAFPDQLSLNGHPTNKLPNTLNINFAKRVGQDLLNLIPEVAASTGSACHSGEVRLSPVLQAMNVDEKEGMGAIRFSLGTPTTKAEIKQVISLIRARF